MAITIDKVIVKLVSYEVLQEIAEDFETTPTDYWTTYDGLLDYEKTHLVTDEELNALKDGTADYVAFRLDD